MPHAPNIPQTGVLEMILVSPRPKAALLGPPEVLALTDRGLEGDHRSRGKGGRKRQVTLIQAEHLHALAALLGRPAVDPRDLRRNLVISGLPLAALGRGRLRVGAVELEITGACEPCARIEAALGPGGEAAAWGLSGFNARVVEGGPLRLGDLARASAAP